MLLLMHCLSVITTNLGYPLLALTVKFFTSEEKQEEITYNKKEHYFVTRRI